jgi:hypothetical protein
VKFPSPAKTSLYLRNKHKVIQCNIGREKEGTCNGYGLVKLISGEERIKP